MSKNKNTFITSICALCANWIGNKDMAAILFAMWWNDKMKGKIK